MKILPILLISLVFCNISNIKQNSAISVFKCLFNDEKFLNSLKNILSSLREHMDDKDVLALIKSLLENVPVAFNEINLCLNSEPLLRDWWDDIEDEFNDITDSLSDYINELGHDFENIGKDLQNEMQKLGVEISENMDNLSNQLENVSQEVLDEIKGDANAMEELYNSVSNDMSDMYSSAFDQVKGVLTDTAVDLELIQKVWDSLPPESKDKVIHAIIDNILEYGEEYALNECCSAAAETLVGCPICYTGITIAAEEIKKLSNEYIHA